MTDAEIAALRADDLRALDREIAELIGWQWGVWVFEPNNERYAVMVPPEYVAAHIGTGEVEWHDGPEPPPLRVTTDDNVPHFSRTWEGFGLLVEEAERRGWRWSIDSPDHLDTPGLKHDAMVRGNYYLGTGPRHAFALAMRDALRAVKEPA